MTKQTTKRVDAVTKSETGKAQDSPRETKISQVIALLERKEGATLEEMVEATDWLPHTMRAALTGLKKKGHTIEREKRDNTACYRITNGS